MLSPYDPLHLGFATKYIKQRFFMDVHPPLAKLMITFVAWFAGYRGNFDFKDIGKYAFAFLYLRDISLLICTFPWQRVWTGSCPIHRYATTSCMSRHCSSAHSIPHTAVSWLSASNMPLSIPPHHLRKRSHHSIPPYPLRLSSPLLHLFNGTILDWFLR